MYSNILGRTDYYLLKQMLGQIFLNIETIGLKTRAINLFKCQHKVGKLFPI